MKRTNIIIMEIEIEKTPVKEKELILKTKLSITDYYEKNIHAKTHVYVPICLFDLQITKLAAFTVEFEAPHKNIEIKRILILAPNGRVVGSSNSKLKCNFVAKITGRFTVKYWLNSWTVFNDSQSYDDFYYYCNVSGTDKEALNISESKMRVYSLLGVGREGRLFKGEKLLEKCLERHTPQKI